MALLERMNRAVDARLPPPVWRDRRDWSFPPSPVGLPWLGVPPDRLRAPLRGLLELRATLGDAFSFRAGPRWLNVFCHPDHVQHILHDNQRNYDKQNKGNEVLRLSLGEGLLTAEGETWLRNRRLAQPAFHRRRMGAFAERMTAAAVELEAQWYEAAGRGEVVDVAESMMSATLRIVCDTVLGAMPGRDLEREVSSALTVMLRETNHRVTSPFNVPMRYATPANTRLKGAIATLDRVVEAIIAQRRAEGASERDDLLTILMQAEDATTGERMHDRQLRDEVLTMFLAGHETTANLLSWAFMLLSQHPGIARALRDEVRGVLGGAPATLESLEQLPLTAAILQETLRLYPPAWIISRSPVEDDQIAGFDVPARSVVYVSSFITQRHPDLWQDPLGFDPERFMGGRGPAHKYAFFPFGGGPRLCIGQSFALLEAKILLATLIQRVGAELLPGHQVEPQPMITLRPGGGLPMRLRRA
jgi:cytochrome P450